MTKFQVAIGELDLEERSRRLCHREATRRGHGSSVEARKPLGTFSSIAAVFAYSAVLTFLILILHTSYIWGQELAWSGSSDGGTFL